MNLRKIFSPRYNETLARALACAVGIFFMRLGWIIFADSTSNASALDWLSEFAASIGFASGLFLAASALFSEMRDLGVLPRFGIDLTVKSADQAEARNSNIHEGHA